MANLNLKQKSKLVSLLRKMGDPDYNEQVVLNQVLEEIENLRGSIPKLPDLSSHYRDVSFLKDKSSSLSSSIINLNDSLNELKTSIKELKGSRDSNSKFIRQSIETVETLKKDISRLNSRLAVAPKEGGGSMNRAIYIGNANPLTRYTDINYIAGNNVTITYQNNDTTKRTDITISATGGSGSGIIRSINNIATSTAAGAASITDYVYIAAGTLTVTLPTSIGNTNLYTIKNVGAGVITVNTTGGDTIDGGTTITMPVQYTSVDLVSNGSGNWNVT